MSRYPRSTRRMIRLTEEEDRRLVAHAQDAGLPPAVYTRLRALARPTPPRRNAINSDVLVHANRAALTCSEMAQAASNVGDLAGARKLHAAAAALTDFVQRLIRDSKGQ
jgi:hypothetical protein